MQNHPSKNRRLLFGIIIKLLIFLGLLLLTLVFLNSLFTDDGGISKNKNEVTPTVSMETTGMGKGQIRKNRWDGREVAILLRQFPEKLDLSNTKNIQKDFQSEYHSSIKPILRSKKSEYFVYFNMGDSKNCPLFYAGGVFKDVCSSNKFDEAGRSIENSLQGYRLEIPPHYFEKDTVIFGQWQP